MRAGLAALYLTLAADPAVTGGPPVIVPPQVLYADLFRDVQLASAFADSKAFADAAPRSPPASILARYAAEHPIDAPSLRAFVQRNFEVPVDGPGPSLPPAPADAVTRLPLRQHIAALWDTLTRASPSTGPWSSLLALPRPYVVPGGRFRELYYWDSYFTMLGLAQDHRQDLLQDMVQDFGYLIDSYGHVPNGTRSYYLGRSQPPFFFAMVALLSPADPAVAYARWLPQLRAEYRYWMDGADDPAAVPAQRRTVRLGDGVVLNRYWDDSALPRDESYREDVTLARTSGRETAGLYRDLRAAAESGWDFSSRWLADGRSLASIHTTDIVPVDLNSLLYGLEVAISEGCRRSADDSCRREFSRRAAQRRRAIDHYLWDNQSGTYRDYDWKRRSRTGVLSAATYYTLFTGASSPRHARSVAASAGRELLRRGGLLPTAAQTGQQWDAPNGWAPLQWIAVAGLRRYGFDADARTIACRWMGTVMRTYDRQQRLLEKYDVVAATVGGGGEYPLQDGFGWTNGVELQLLHIYPEYGGVRDPGQCAAQGRGVGAPAGATAVSASTDGGP